MLDQLGGTGAYVFSSFHISEEFDQSYPQRAREMCRWLQSRGFRLIGDVSKKTLQMFGCDHILTFARELGIEVLRLDYGFSPEETAEITAAMPVAVNASTIPVREAASLTGGPHPVYAIHNFYPRPETGLDPELFTRLNRELRAVGVEVFSFIPGDEVRRGPLFEGLPTLEAHRSLPPYCAFVELEERYGIPMIFAADPVLSQRQLTLIQDYTQSGIISLPAQLLPQYESLYGQVFTVRVDSPACTMRLQESREYSCFGSEVAPQNCIPRQPGVVTVDNSLYGRYSGEVQVLREALPADERVNVAGQILPEYSCLTHCIRGGTKLRLIKG